LTQLRRLEPYLRRHAASVALGAAGLVVAAVFGVLVPWLIRDAIDGLSAPDGRARLTREVSLILLLALGHGVLRWLSRRALLVAGRRVEQALRRDLFAHVVRLPLDFFSRVSTGDVMSRMTNDLAAVWLLLGPGVLMLMGTVVSWFLAVGFMFRISPSLTLAALAAAPLVVLASREYGRRFHVQHLASQQSLAALNETLHEDVSGIRLVKAYGLERAMGERFDAAASGYRDRSLDLARTSAAFHALIAFVSGLAVALVLLYAGWQVVRGELTTGGFVAFNAYLAMLSFPTMALGWVINLFQRGAAAMGRIGEFLDLEPESTALLQPAADDDGVPLIEARHLSFAFAEGGRGEVLRDVSFEIRRGEVVGLVGRTGSGKSALLSLLLRMQPVPPGTVFWRGRDVDSVPLPELRRAVALVGQDPFLYSDSILGNVCLGMPEADRAAAATALARARMAEEIAELPDGVDTVIGERGISLSGGQKQRVTIARALCTGAELLLLDDALSAVDADTEQAIFRELMDARAGRTILFSTHRLASLSRCDRILVLDGGRIVEAGRHEELLALGGVYRALHSRGSLEREIEAAT
jgi:ATP-binding cassette subfamily B protein